MDELLIIVPLGMLIFWVASFDKRNLPVFNISVLFHEWSRVKSQDPSISLLSNVYKKQIQQPTSFDWLLRIHTFKIF